MGRFLRDPPGSWHRTLYLVRFFLTLQIVYYFLCISKPYFDCFGFWVEVYVAHPIGALDIDAHGDYLLALWVEHDIDQRTQVLLYLANYIHLFVKKAPAIAGGGSCVSQTISC